MNIKEEKIKRLREVLGPDADAIIEAAIKRQELRTIKSVNQGGWDKIYDNMVLDRMFTELRMYHRHSDPNRKIKSATLVVWGGWNACEAMMEIILLLKGISVEKGAVKTEEIIANPEQKPISAATYCIKNPGVIPEECRKFLILLDTYRDKFAQNNKENDKEQVKVVVDEFVKTMDYFIAWFYEQYIVHPASGHVDEDLKYRFMPYVRIHEEEKAKSDNHSDEEIVKSLLQKIEEQTGILSNLSSQVERIDERSERIEYTVNEIDRKLEELTGQITAYQSLLERQIEKADSDLEKDRIIQGYADECSERIVKATNASAEKQALEIERRKLVASIGEQSWNKLEDTSKTFIISAKVMYNHLILLDDQTDYSGVCVLITKAMEVEMSKRFYTRFLAFLDATYQKDYSKYHSALLFNGYKPMKPEKFTMGSIAFAMCYLENRNESEAQKKQNRDCLMAYARKELFPGKSDSEISDLLKEYAVAIEKIRNDYRNPSAHTNQLHQVDAEKCFNLVLDVEKLLKKMLDSFSS